MLQVDASNVLGLGARRLAERLLPALQNAGGEVEVRQPSRSSFTRPLERLLSCLKRDDRPGTLLVLGDIPLRHAGRQIVFVQNAHLLSNSETPHVLQKIKNRASRFLFSRNLRFADAFVVQTVHMRIALEENYPNLRGKVSITRQPAVCVEGATRREWRGGKLRLCYPAAPYPHKNHAVLASAMRLPEARAVVSEIATTHSHERSSAEVAQMYSAADALVFPSLTESYGLPLVEAMSIGMPIVAADRPYARELCGPTAIYFDPLSPDSLVCALHQLKRRLDAGWRPNWSPQLSTMPKDWDEVARAFLGVIQQAQVPSDGTRCQKQARPGAGAARQWAFSR